MVKRITQQIEPANQVALAFPISVLEGTASSTTSHVSHNISSPGDIQDLTPAVLGRSDLFPCTKKRSWSNSLVVQLVAQQS